MGWKTGTEGWFSDTKKQKKNWTSQNLLILFTNRLLVDYIGLFIQNSLTQSYKFKSVKHMRLILQ